MKEFLIPTKLDKLSDIFIALGQLFFGSTVLPFVIPGLDRGKVAIVVLGLIISLIFWLLAILIVKEKR